MGGSAVQVEEGEGFQNEAANDTSDGRCALFVPMKHLRRLAHASGLKELATTLRHMRSVDRVEGQYACISAHLDARGEKELCELLLRSVDVVRFCNQGSLGDGAVRLVVDSSVLNTTTQQRS